jgi:hypothetical protein
MRPCLSIVAGGRGVHRRWFALYLLVISTGCAESPDKRIVVWAEPPSRIVPVNALPQSETAIFNRDEDLVRLRGAAGEVVACQLALHGGETGLGPVELIAGDYSGPRGSFSRRNVEMFLAHAVAVEEFPAWYLRRHGAGERREFHDVLVPLDAPRLGQPFRVGPGRTAVVWYEVHVPPSTSAGLYQSQVVVRSAGSGIRTVRLWLEVLPFTLPDKQRPAVVGRLNVRQLLSAHLGSTAADPTLLTSRTPHGHRARRLVGSVIRLLREHRVDAYFDDILPVLELDAEGRVVLKWDDYDGAVGPFLDGAVMPGGQGITAWPLPISRNFPDPEQFGGPSATGYFRVLQDALRFTGQHFGRRNWMGRQFIVFDSEDDSGGRSGLHRLSSPDPLAAVEWTPEDYDRLRRIGGIIRKADPSLRVLSTVMPRSMRDFGWSDHHWEDVVDLVDILAVPSRLQHNATLERFRRGGKATWLVPDRPPYTGTLALTASPSDVRSLPWQAFLQGHEAVWLPTIGLGPKTALNETFSDTAEPTAEWLLYPGTLCGLEGPIPSLRLKQLQQASQEAALLEMLVEHNRRGTAHLLASSLIKATGTDLYMDHYLDAEAGWRVRETEWWDLARRIADEELSAAVNPAPSAGASVIEGLEGRMAGSTLRGMAGGAPAADWDRLLRNTRGVVSWVESVRIRPPARPADTHYVVEVNVALRNELMTPVAGQWSFDSLPPNWQAIVEQARIDRVEPGAFVRQRLLLQTPRIAVDLHGHAELTLTFAAARSGSQVPMGQTEMRAGISAVLAAPTPKPIVLDGNLNDWLVGVHQAAGDFRPVGETPIARIGEGGARVTPDPPGMIQQTVAYFAHDREHLYIALSCRSERSADRGRASTSRVIPDQRSNILRYDDLMPVGEEMVEILLDPGGEGKEMSDIYHVVVKADGPLIFERGIGIPNSLGRRRPWAADIRYVCRRTSDGWTAELAIPLAAMDVKPSAGAIWGVNITRFETQPNRYSSWSGAARHAYNPMTFGNILWQTGP